jgi:hypothetical protein
VRISGWGIAYAALAALALVEFSKPARPDVSHWPVSAKYCAGYGVLMAAPAALACWYRVRKRSLLPRPHTGLSFAGNLLMICGGLGAMIGLRADPEHCKEIICLSAVGLAIGGLLAGVFDVAATCFRNQWSSAVSLYLLCGILVLATVFSGPLRWGGLSMVLAVLLTRISRLVSLVRGMVQNAAYSRWR